MDSEIQRERGTRRLDVVTGPAVPGTRLQHIGTDSCGFCGGPGPYGTYLQALFRYMAEMIRAEWADTYDEVLEPLTETLWLDAPPPFLETDELLAEMGEPLANMDLRRVFVKAFEHEWCQANFFRLRPHERLAAGWGAFARYVKEESRYLFLRTGRSGAEHPDPDEIEPAAMLEELGMSIVNSGLIRRLPEGSGLFRARQHSLKEVLATPAQLGSPSRETPSTPTA